MRKTKAREDIKRTVYTANESSRADESWDLNNKLSDDLRFSLSPLLQVNLINKYSIVTSILLKKRN